MEHNEASSFFTTFNTPFGRFRFTRMPFGLTVAGYTFQCKLDAIFNSLDFYTGIADDMMIWGEDADGSDFDKHLTKFLSVTRQHNINLNLDKLQLVTKQASFFDTTFTYDGSQTR